MKIGNKYESANQEKDLDLEEVHQDEEVEPIEKSEIEQKDDQQDNATDMQLEEHNGLEILFIGYYIS